MDANSAKCFSTSFDSASPNPYITDKDAASSVSPVDSVGATSVMGGIYGVVGPSSVINSMEEGDLLCVEDFEERRPYFTNLMTIGITPQTLD
jgi:hypothetical protein